jgi:(1->4)-alpha-D-glucan 1-alpha-D-glucosylmutase
MIPRATYRTQFHKGFPFADAIPLASYLAKLGISHLYASPILAARAGSPHGYDVIDHTRINPELGSEEGLRRLVSALRGAGLGLVVDIVPNHMAVGGADNPWWLDVLENGSHSHYATMFDIDWDPPDPMMRGRILAPFLGYELEECLAKAEIALIWDARLGKIAFGYHEHRFPLRREDYAALQSDGGEPPESALREWNAPERLIELLERQHYRLAFWQTAPEKINWRRFFDITGLAALRIEDETVFEAVHAEVFRLYAAGLIDGMRVDHIDGLTDPTAYCIRLRRRLDALATERPQAAPRGPAYLVVEKILAPTEELPRVWPVDGTTGYDFMNDVSALQTDANGETPLTRLWTEASGRAADFETEETDARHELLHGIFGCEWRAAAAVFRRLALFAAREIEQPAIEDALDRLIGHFRAYRTYATGREDSPLPGPFFERALQAARDELADEGGLDLIASAMRGEMAKFGKWSRESVRHLNQLMAPLAAKAVEDTAFYRYGRLLSRNDVGFDPGTFAIPVSEFHARVRRRVEAFPNAMLVTATHDHKRGEDLRARLAVLSELTDLWRAEVGEWFRLNASLSAPPLDRGDEYRLYQMIAGAWPAALAPHDAAGLGEFAARMLDWRAKSLREAKLATSWVATDPTFEAANADFVRAILDPGRAPGFLERVADFVTRIAPAGAMNGLTQALLRCTVPGVPDHYQGTEFWDLSLVDPDNRRPVDYVARVDALALAGPEPPPLEEWRSGTIKQWLISRLLALRADDADLLRYGEYVPVAARGPGAKNVIAFLRRLRKTAILVAAPLHCARACVGQPLPDPKFWADTALAIPHAPWQNRLGAPITDPHLLSQLFARFPGAVLIARE